LVLALSTLLLTAAVVGLIGLTGTAAAASGNTAQLDFSAIYNADVVRGTADSTEGDFDNGGYTLVSSSAATTAADGLPDDGVIPEQTDVHPRLDLADFNSDDANAWQTTGTGEVTADVTDDQYETVHVVASAGGAGPSTPAKFEVDLQYGDGSTVTSPVYTVPDWFGSPPADPGYAVRDGMDRYNTATDSYEEANQPGIWGYAVSTDSSKTLTQVTIDVTENQAGAFNFFGGAATTQSSSVVNSPPSASSDSATTDEDVSVTVDVVSNDKDPDGDTLEVSQITNGPGHGTAQITGASSDKIRLDPGTDQTGDVTITYEVSDGNGGTDTATLSVTVDPVNDEPTASDDSVSTNEDVSVTVDVVDNDNDPDGDSLDVTRITSGPGHGTAQITGASDDQIEFDPGADETGSVSITYEVSDGNGGTDTATLSVTVNSVNDPPSITLGGDQTARRSGQQTVSDFATGFDPGGGADESGQSVADFTVTVTKDPSSVLSSVDVADGDNDDAGALTYTANSDVSGTATVAVQVVDDGGTANGGSDTSASATFDIAVDTRSGGGGGGPEDTTAVLEPQNEWDDRPTTSATIDLLGVSKKNPTVRVPLDVESWGGLRVTSVSRTFSESTRIDNEIHVEASNSPPTDVPATSEEGVLGYVTVEVGGTLADHVSDGSVTVSVDAIDREVRDAGRVVGETYRDGEWHPVETSVIDTSSVEVHSPNSTTFALRLPVDDEPTEVTTATPGAGGGTPTTTPTRTPTASSTQSENSAPTETPTSASSTAGETGPGFGVLIAIVALGGLLARATWQNR
jgi:PGF-CTERM protein